MGEASPPTQWQPFFFGIVITRIRVDPKHAIALVTRDFHPRAQRPDAVALARPVRRLPPGVESGGTVLQPADHPLPLPGPGGFLRQRLALLLPPGQAQAGKARRKRGLVNATLRLPVDQPGHALAPLAALVFDGGQRRAFGAGLGLQAPPGCRRQPLRGGEPGTACLPHRQVPPVGPPLRMRAAALAPTAVGLRAQTAVRGVGAGGAWAGTRPEALPVAGRATGLALAQAVQQIPGPPARWAGMGLVLLELGLSCGAHLRGYQGGPRDRAPVLRGDLARRPNAAAP
jgi:hypothetical protein